MSENEELGINFVREFTSLAHGTEAPEYFALWTGISGVSMMLGRRAVLDMGNYKIYPNFYVLLIAGSGKMRKSTTIDWLTDVFDEMASPPRVIAQKITPEAFIQRMSEGDPDEENLVPNAEAIVIADEFITFLNKRSWDQGLGEFLLPMYDCKNRFAYSTKGSGEQVLEKCCCNLLGGATMRGISDDMPPQLIGSGLASRFIFVYVKDHDVAVLRDKRIKERRAKITRLARGLERIKMIQGEVELTDGAWDLADQLYHSHRNQNKYYDDPNLSGYASRWHKHFLALSIILAASERYSLTIQKKDIAAAHELIKETEAYYPEVIAQIKGTPTGNVQAEVLQMVQSHRRIRYADLVKHTKHLMTARELSEVIHTLQSAGEIEYEQNAPHPTIRYIIESERPGNNGDQ